MDAEPLIPQPLGLNQSSYMGERIDILAINRRLRQAALHHGWKEEIFLSLDSIELIALHRRSENSKYKLYLSSGIHGDEPAGPLAILELIEQNQWPADWDIWICPCLNPTGFVLNRRENAAGIDLNRQYHAPESEEVKAHVRWLNSLPKFDLAICVHEDWESKGYYLYELNPDNQATHALDIIEAVAKVCPIDRSPEIEGRPAVGGIIRPSVDPLSRPQWPEAFYLLVNKTRHSYTLESPSDFPLPVRVRAHTTALRVILDEPHSPK